MDIIGAVVVGVVVIVTMVLMYKLGYCDGRHEERMRLLNMIAKIPPVDKLIMESKSQYDSRYSSLYVIDYIIQKMREE